ncbi:HGGxSTG domain-containing protein [Thalassovita sp.]|uniref:HGGxSTG domain-containing protein n=1 Tax=Thalassovita sp. TaxID=1979401 RepID=UPI0029DE605F|nr:HGGxSTG domain-containing protein [Thalassovita sp.]
MTGDELKALRTGIGLSRPALAKMAGLHPDTVKYWEGKPRVRPYEYGPRRLLSALGVQIVQPENRGNNVTTTRAWDRVLSKVGYFRPSQAQRRCGAKTRKGTPCRAKSLPGKKRCKFHGGASTGPRTAEGRKRISEAQKRRWERLRKGEKSAAVSGNTLTV